MLILFGILLARSNIFKAKSMDGMGEKTINFLFLFIRSSAHFEI
jgi:hypothetical protein